MQWRRHHGKRIWRIGILWWEVPLFSIRWVKNNQGSSGYWEMEYFLPCWYTRVSQSSAMAPSSVSRWALRELRWTNTRYLAASRLSPHSTTVTATRSGKQTHSEGQCRQRSAVYYTGRPKAESPLSQGPRPAFVKIFYSPCVHVQTHHPNPLRLTKER